MKRLFVFLMVLALVSSTLAYEKGPIIYPAQPRTSIYAPSDTQEYELGARCITEDGRVFRYARTGTGGVVPGYGAAFQCTLAIGENLHANAAIGATYVRIEQSAITKDQFAGGYIVVGHGSQATTQNRRIISNTASEANESNSVESNHVDVYLDKPLEVAVTTSSYCEIIPNPYYDTTGGSYGNSYASFGGIPATVATVGQFYWLQTWGPCWVVPGGGDAPGDAASERSVYFVGDGSVNGAGNAIAIESGYQLCGFIIQKDSSGSGGPPFVMLQISP